MASLQHVRDMLAKLVSFETVSARTNLPLIEYVQGYLAGCGVKHVTVMRSADGIHANLLATLPSAGGSVEGGLLLSGHTDVVPVDGQKWTSDPFVLTERDGNLYGRGSCDMKAFIAVCLALVPEWVCAPPRKPVQIALTYDEETTFDGVRQLMRERGSDLKKCEGCIIGEPTMLDLVIAHKGIFYSYITFKGKAAHSSLQTAGYNSIEPAMHVFQKLFEMRDRFAREGPFEEGFNITHTTLCPTLTTGGNAINTIPAECSLGFEFRNVPSHAASVIKKEIWDFVGAETERVKLACPEGGMEVVKCGEVEPFGGNKDASVVKALLAANPELPKVTKVSFCTEAGEYQAAGINSVVCGPGNIEQAHKANEFVSLEQLDKGLLVVRRVVQLMCGGSEASQL
ncbi:acetylornithine deacetylase-like protein [Leishmania major strain Friedlin]|uniref:Acetylornithine deacetylase-like protein n=1 Tax=Leishmania major TaxID=5664 RepID=Q4QIR7_LEIMA|nr:acetylornithine deacetylase-like protein [Leishmania major strain Friedlin]CAG9568961.1 acetylornithine_deacetylase-like_protein [Leishmania major strain Friedlin]CAJ06986.1 acetylornithine deacetylase-like protein [Leishmania major strain Friedlin]|eukprot:XP_001680931.1 acetylornithine deacetylase-like protein [Leishmania major strain Friedlin]